MTPDRILIVGGKGHFGQLLAEDLRRHVKCDIVIGGRRFVDVTGASVVVCTAGPFQTLSTTLVEECLSHGVHYIDFSDSRQFVQKVRAVAAHHQRELPAVCTAWSTVSALSGLMAQIATGGATSVDGIYIHMAPGNRVPRGSATIASLLYSVGTSFTVCRDGEWRQVRGWSEEREFVFPPPIGPRRGYLVDVPDHEFFPELFNARTVEFRTASELRILNGAVSSLAWFVEKGFIRNWATWSRWFQRNAALFGSFGHDWGGVGVEAFGEGFHRRVSVVADSGGQRIAVMPASIMVEMLLSGARQSGLVSHAHWLSREQLHAACEKRGFRMIVEDL